MVEFSVLYISMWHFNGACEILNRNYYTVLYPIIPGTQCRWAISCNSSFNMCGADLRLYLFKEEICVGQRKSFVMVEKWSRGNRGGTFSYLFRLWGTKALWQSGHVTWALFGKTIFKKPGTRKEFPFRNVFDIAYVTNTQREYVIDLTATPSPLYQFPRPARIPTYKHPIRSHHSEHETLY